MKDRINYILIFIIAVGLGIGFDEIWRHRQKESANANREPDAIPVQALTLTTETIDIPIECPGRTTAFKLSEIRPQVNGIVQKRLFTEGGHIKQNEQLYQIDPALFIAASESAKAGLASAEASLKTAQFQADRYKSLVKIGGVSKQEYEDSQTALVAALANVQVAKAAVDTAQINLDYTKVYAPISGIIGKSSVTEGALINANQANALALITQLDPIYIDLTLTSKEGQILRQEIKKSGSKKITLSQVKESLEGEIQFVGITIDETTDSLNMRALVPNSNEVLLPGQFVRAKVDISVPNSILVPQQATSRDASGNLNIWVIGDDNKVKSVQFKSERAIGNKWLVEEGLKVGDKIVTDGMIKMKPGVLVAPNFSGSGV